MDQHEAFGDSQLGDVAFLLDVVGANDTDATVFTNVRNGDAIVRIHNPGHWTLQLAARDRSNTTVLYNLGSWAVEVIPARNAALAAADTGSVVRGRLA